MAKRKWQRAYRGVNTAINGAESDIDEDNLGVHWTPRFEVAEKFALNLQEPMGEPSGMRSRGQVLEAFIPKKGVIAPGTDEYKKIASETGILHPDSDEEEITVRKGTPVRVTKTHLLGQQFNGKTQEHDFLSTLVHNEPAVKGRT